MTCFRNHLQKDSTLQSDYKKVYYENHSVTVSQ